MNRNTVKNLMLLSFLCFLTLGCATHKPRAYYPQTSTLVVPTESRIDKRVSVEDFRIISIDRKNRKKTINLLEDSDEDLANAIKSSFIDNLHKSRLFSQTHADDSTADFKIKGYIQNLKLLSKPNAYGIIYQILGLPIAAFGGGALGAGIAISTDRSIYLDEQDRKVVNGLILFGTASIAYVLSPFIINTGTNYISFDMVLDFHDIDNNLIKTYSSTYQFSQRFKDVKDIFIVKQIDSAFDETFLNLKEAIIEDRETLLHSTK